MKKIFVGIDVSKMWIDVCVTMDGKITTHQQFENTKKGFKAMVIWFMQFGKLREEWLLCMEHTGIYALPLWYFLTEQKITYCVVPGSVITSGLEIRRGKNDKIDAADIARFTMRYADELKPHRLPAQVLQRLRMLFAYRERLVKASVLLKVPAMRPKNLQQRKVRKCVQTPVHWCRS